MSGTVITMWDEHLVLLHWVSPSKLPPNATITTAHGICFSDEDHIVLVDLETRGWDFPGGHIENNETPEDCLEREAMEEACIAGELRILGYIAVDNSHDPLWEPSKYPAVGYQAYYRMNVTEVYPFVQEFESSKRKNFPVDEVVTVHGRWNALYQHIIDSALTPSESV